LALLLLGLWQGSTSWQNKTTHITAKEKKEGEKSGFYNPLQGHTHNGLKLHTRPFTGSKLPSSNTLDHDTNYSKYLGASLIK
jgi:hypothetical protein